MTDQTKGMPQDAKRHYELLKELRELKEQVKRIADFLEQSSRGTGTPQRRI